MNHTNQVYFCIKICMNSVYVCERAAQELPEFEFAFKELGRLIVDVGALITAQCDRCVALCEIL